MRNRKLAKQMTCLALALFLMAIFCTIAHDCHNPQCPVCSLFAAQNWGLVLLAIGFELQAADKAEYNAHQQPKVAGKGQSLIALKVKLTD